MRNILIIFVILAFLSVNANAQKTAEFYQKKIKTYSNMQSTGIIVLGAGGLALVVGYTGLQGDGMGDILLGYIAGLAGIGLTTAGTILTIEGTVKVKIFKNKLKEISLAPCITPKQAGFQLTYRF